MLSNMFTDLNLTDMETCYKAFRREVLESFELQEDRFGFEPEITAKVARAGLARLRGRHLLLRPHLRRGQEDRLARRRARAVLHRALLAAARAVERPSGRAGRPRRSSSPSPMPRSSRRSLDSLRDADNYADWIFDLCEPHLGARCSRSVPGTATSPSASAPVAGHRHRPVRALRRRAPHSLRRRRLRDDRLHRRRGCRR